MTELPTWAYILIAVVFTVLIICVVLITLGSSALNTNTVVVTAAAPVRFRLGIKNPAGTLFYATVYETYLVLKSQEPIGYFTGDDGEVLLYQGTTELKYSTIAGDIRTVNNSSPIRLMYNSVGDTWTIAVGYCTAYVGDAISENRRLQVFQDNSVNYCPSDANPYKFTICGGNAGDTKDRIIPLLFTKIPM